jgi:hypothetical protein
MFWLRRLDLFVEGWIDAFLIDVASYTAIAGFLSVAL